METDWQSAGSDGYSVSSDGSDRLFCFGCDLRGLFSGFKSARLCQYVVQICSEMAFGCKGSGFGSI